MYRTFDNPRRKIDRALHGHVYDRESVLVGRVLGTRVYDLNGHRRGELVEDRVYDEDGARLGRVISGHLYDGRQVQVGRVDSHGQTYDMAGEKVGEVHLSDRNAALMGAAALLLLLEPTPLLPGP